jgi:YfiH family protein
MVTDCPGVLLGVLTADCAPVLFADEEAGVAAAAHSGWRGAIGGVNEATIEAMEQLGARRERIAAAIGPSVEQKSYEVDQAFRERFIEEDEANGRFFIVGPAGKPHFDLTGYILQRLDNAGIAKAEALRLDTYSDPDRFYSYRRSTHRNEPSYGRQISMIGLPFKS